MKHYGGANALSHDIDLSYVHMLGKKNIVADILSRWKRSGSNYDILNSRVQSPIWIEVSYECLLLYNEL